MIAELCFHRAVNLVQLRGEDNVVELPDHLALSELTQITAFLAGRAG